MCVIIIFVLRNYHKLKCIKLKNTLEDLRLKLNQFENPVPEIKGETVSKKLKLSIDN